MTKRKCNQGIDFSLIFTILFLLLIRQSEKSYSKILLPLASVFGLSTQVSLRKFPGENTHIQDFLKWRRDWGVIKLEYTAPFLPATNRPGKVMKTKIQELWSCFLTLTHNGHVAVYGDKKESQQIQTFHLSRVLQTQGCWRRRKAVLFSKKVANLCRNKCIFSTKDLKVRAADINGKLRAQEWEVSLSPS